MLQHDEHRAALRSQLATGASAWVTCDGRSMEPTIRLGERVRVRAVRRVRPGDIVLFENGARDGYILHRVVCPLPGGARFVHIGDRPGCRPGIAPVASVIGAADGARRLPAAGWWRVAVAVSRAGWRRFRRR